MTKLKKRSLSFIKPYPEEVGSRDYGLLKTARGSTRYPQSISSTVEDDTKSMMSTATRKTTDALRDSGSLKARLSTTQTQKTPSFLTDPEAESMIQVDFSEPLPEPVLSFEMRRKLFDQAEFTICKGRKITDAFHGVDLSPKFEARSSLLSKYEERKSNDKGTLKELEAFCKAHNFKIIHSHNNN